MSRYDKYGKTVTWEFSDNQGFFSGKTSPRRDPEEERYEIALKYCSAYDLETLLHFVRSSSYPFRKAGFEESYIRAEMAEREDVPF